MHLYQSEEARRTCVTATCSGKTRFPLSKNWIKLVTADFRPWLGILASINTFCTCRIRKHMWAVARYLFLKCLVVCVDLAMLKFNVLLKIYEILWYHLRFQSIVPTQTYSTFKSELSMWNFQQKNILLHQGIYEWRFLSQIQSSSIFKFCNPESRVRIF